MSDRDFQMFAIVVLTLLFGFSCGYNAGRTDGVRAGMEIEMRAEPSTGGETE